MTPTIHGETGMNTHKIEVSLVHAASSPTGKALSVKPPRMEIPLSNRAGDEHALVTWTFKDLPAGLKPVITFESREVIAAGPTTTKGAAPQVTFEIRFPPELSNGLRKFSARYRISLSSGATTASDPIPAPVEEPSLVVIRSPDPPGNTVRPAVRRADPSNGKARPSAT